MSVFEELKRRNVFRVGIAYVIGGWLLLQLTDVLSELLDLPDVVGRTIVLVVAIGLPIALFLAWAFELTPEGVKREKEVDRSQSITQNTGKTLNNTILVMMALAIAYLLFDKFSGQQPATSVNEVAEVATQAEPALTPEVEDSRQSIAVLPFENRSHEESDEFFVAGVHDDLLTNLARVSALKVISRTSVSLYKNSEKSIPQIAQELGVTTIMEGAVQRSGNTVRINVQLIDAKTDEHLWAEIFDRELNTENLFAIQSEISQKIADALETTLTDAETNRINTMPTNNMEAYEAYTRGRVLMASRESAKLEQAAGEFNKAVKLDPDFALAWVGVADSHMLWELYGTLERDKAVEIMDVATNRALAIDDQLGEAYASLGQLQKMQGEPEKTEAAYIRAIELNPNYATAYHWYAFFLNRYPLRAQEQIDLYRKALELDPRSAIIGTAFGGAYLNHGLYSRAERQFLKVLDIQPDFPEAVAAIASVYRQTGRLELALKYLRMAAEQDQGNPQYLWQQAYIYLQIGEFKKADAIRQQVEEIEPGGIGGGFYDIWANIVRGNKAAAREALKWTLPRAQQYNFDLEYLGEIETAIGSPERARELFVQSDPGWLQPDSWQRLVESKQTQGCDFAWILIQTGDAAMGEQLSQFTIKYLTEDLPAAIEHADRYSPVLCHLVSGDMESYYASLEILLAHNHLGYYRTRLSQFPMFAATQHDPRVQSFLAEYDRLIEQQRIAVEKLDAETGP